MKSGAAALLAIWTAIMALGIYGFGLDSLGEGLNFRSNRVESAMVAWLIFAGLPLASLWLYWRGRQQDPSGE